MIQTLGLVLKKDRAANQLRFIIVALPHTVAAESPILGQFGRDIPLFFTLKRLWFGRIFVEPPSWKYGFSCIYHANSKFSRNQQWFPQFHLSMSMDCLIEGVHLISLYITINRVETHYI